MRRAMRTIELKRKRRNKIEARGQHGCIVVMSRIKVMSIRTS